MKFQLPEWSKKKYFHVPLWGWLAGGTGFLWLVWAGRDQVSEAGSDIVEGVQTVAANISSLIGGAFDFGDSPQFEAALPSPSNEFGDTIIQVAQEQGVSPALIYGIGDRESLWGNALSPKGAAGTGDWSVRTGHWTTGPNVAVYDSTTDSVDTLKALGFSFPKSSDASTGVYDSKGNGPYVAGPYAVPSDHQGWGRGLMQLDYANSLTVDWQDAYSNLVAAMQLFKSQRDQIATKTGLTGDALDEAAVAAYNTGVGNVAKSIAAGNPVDSTTTGKDYSGAVLAKASGILAKTKGQTA